MPSLYARPLPFNAADVTVDTLPPLPLLPPVAAFTVTPPSATGNLVTIRLQDTSSNQPDTIEFDLTDNGSYDVVLPGGAAYDHAFSAGTYTIRMRASNAAGSSTTTRTLTITSALTLGAPYLVGFNSGSTTMTTPAGGQFNNGFDDVRVSTTDSSVSYQLFRNYTGVGAPDYTGSGILVSGPGTQGSTNIFRIPIPRAMTLLSRAGDQILVSCSNAAGANGQTFTMNPVARQYYPPSSFAWTLDSLGPEGPPEVGRNAAYRALNFSNPIYPNTYSLGQSSAIVSGTPFNPLAAPINSAQNSIVQTWSGPVTAAGSFSFTVRVTGDSDVMAAPFQDYPVSVVVYNNGSTAPALNLVNTSIPGTGSAANAPVGTYTGSFTTFAAQLNGASSIPGTSPSFPFTFTGGVVRFTGTASSANAGTWRIYASNAVDSTSETFVLSVT